ncbi:MAG: hypothetical protein LBV17_03090 [Treponema sp.]|nr:hypothetical protein [Treponema sp.]
MEVGFIVEANEFNVKGIKMTIIEKPEHEMVGYKKSANFDDGSIDLFVKELVEDGKVGKLAKTLKTSQHVWLCLADCLSCGLNCGLQVCCIVCVEKTENHDFSKFANNELFTFRLPASKWVRYEMYDIRSFENLFKYDIYKLVHEIGYKWNEAIRLHFDNQYECHNGEKWNDGKIGYFLLPVVPL